MPLQLHTIMTSLSMRDAYATDEDFALIYKSLQEGKSDDDFSLKEGFLMHGKRLCIIKELREKVMLESHAPPYAGHRGVQTTFKAIKTYFYWSTMKTDIHTLGRVYNMSEG